jgi:ERF superfamily
VQRSSDSVAALAAALAKAQSELVNPEKSLTATIRAAVPGVAERSFRYAPLSSGLDIIRKTLGQHEIATIQTTAIDQASGLVNLTTMLAHTSGQWIASDWPVCPIAEMANPQRMGAALTYARRYALFTLVGIAGEDDLDAPDLSTCTPMIGRGPDPRQEQLSSRHPGNGRQPSATKRKTVELLDPERSATLRDQLLAEVANLASAELAVTWAYGALTAKNTLVADDAKLLEEAFEQRLSGLSPLVDIETPTGAGDGPFAVTMRDEPQASKPLSDQPRRIDKSVLTFAAPRRYRNREHLRFVTQQGCLICGRKPSDAHHLRHIQPRALGRKASDEFAVPLCRVHHRAAHRVTDERAWWKAAGIDAIRTARRLWKETRVNEGQLPPDAITQKPKAGLDLDSQPIGSTGPDIG